MNDRQLGGLHAAVIQLLVQCVQLDDAERVSIAEAHQTWRQRAYGANEYVRHGVTDAGRSQLWVSTRSVPATAPAPDQPASPQNWKKLE